MGDYDYWLPPAVGEATSTGETRPPLPRRRTKVRLFARSALSFAGILGPLGFVQVFVATGELYPAVLILALALALGLVTGALVVLVADTDDASVQRYAERRSQRWSWRTFVILGLAGGSSIALAAELPWYVSLLMLAAAVTMFAIDFRDRRAENSDRG